MAEKTPEEWCRLTGIKIMDPDGWRGHMADVKITDPITREEFIRRAKYCTVARWPMPLHDELTDDSLPLSNPGSSGTDREEN